MSVQLHSTWDCALTRLIFSCPWMASYWQVFFTSSLCVVINVSTTALNLRLCSSYFTHQCMCTEHTCSLLITMLYVNTSMSLSIYIPLSLKQYNQLVFAIYSMPMLKAESRWDCHLSASLPGYLLSTCRDYVKMADILLMSDDDIYKCIFLIKKLITSWLTHVS